MKLQFNIKTLMLVVAIWAIPNALFAWMVRSNPRAFPQAEQSFVGINISLVILALFVVYSEVLHRYTKRGKSTAQIRAQWADARKNAPSLLVFHALILLSIAFWYFNHFFRIHGLHYGHLAVLILVVTVATMVRSQIRRRPSRRDWTSASFVHVASGIAAIAWTIGAGYTLFVYKPHLLAWGLKPWFPISPAMLLMLLGMSVLQGVAVVSMRIAEQAAGREAGHRPPE